MSKTPTSSDLPVRSEYVPRFKTQSEREAFRESMLDELATVVRNGELRPASQDARRSVQARVRDDK